MSEQQPWYKRRQKGWDYFHTTPLKKLRMMFLAVFLLFSTVGFFSALMPLGRMPWPLVLFNALASGVVAVLYALAAVRYSRRAMILLSLGQAIFWTADGMFVSYVMSHGLLPPMTTQGGVRFCAIGILAGAMSSYSCFLHFIRSQGSEVFLVRNELELAHGIQKTLVPAVSLSLAGYEVYGISRPSDKVGGDLVDAVLLPSGDGIVYCADIAGHGLSAGILMGMLKTATRTVLLDEDCPLPSLFARLNRVLPAVKEPHMYATCTAMRLGAGGKVEYALAASPPLLHWSGQSRKLGVISEPQLPLGLLPGGEFSGNLLEVSRGDLLVVATDGILEASNREDVEFGIDRLCSVIERHSQAPLNEVAEHILAEVNLWGKQVDDQTVLLVRCA